MLNLLLSKYKAYAYAIAIAAWFFAGYKTSSHFSDEAIEDLVQEHEQLLAQIDLKNEQALKEKQDHINNLQQEFSIADDKYREAMNHVKAENDRLYECFKSGDCVQYVKVEDVVCTSGDKGKDSNSKPAYETTKARLDRQVAADSNRITDEGDQAIIDLTALQDKVRSCANAGLCPFEFL